MEKEFLPYELAIKLKEMGFDEECFRGYASDGEIADYTNSFKNYNDSLFINAPLWQQAFAFLLRNLKNRELIVALEFDGEVTLWEVITEDTYETYNKILASGNKESLEKLIELYSQLRKEVETLTCGYCDSEFSKGTGGKYGGYGEVCANCYIGLS